ncbi:TonB-dependent siderophore receptor [Methylobacterium indicum]|uniref:TonB-dependent siderophore receptor n=1 Tax=Methylobacterium indicum TaxID=1775910 RepID=UPI0024355217|nr:TonB-dependent siderophore receptor [Methylobacterium indicum]
MVKRIQGATSWRLAMAGASLSVMSHALAAQETLARSPQPGSGDRVGIVPITERAAAPARDASAVRKRISIAPGPLDPALKALEEQGSLRLAYETTLTKDLATRGIDGEFRPLDALVQVLDGTGLTYRDAGRATFALVNPRYVQLGAPAQAESIPLEEISVQGPAPQDMSIARNGSATGSGSPSGIVGYTVKSSPTATKTSTPLIETPQSVTVIPREQLDDRGVQTLIEALSYAPGISTETFGFNPGFDSFYIRGFLATFDSVYRDGLRRAAVGFAVPHIEPYGTDAITILRGPSAGLYGLGSPGGIVDATSKRPVFTRFGEAVFQAGSYDRFQGSFDFGGPVDGTDGTLAYRLTGIVRQSNSFLPGATDDRISIAPSFTWKPSTDTTFTLLTEFQDSKLPATSSFYNFPGFRVSRLYEGDAGFNKYSQQQYRIGYAFEHRFSPNLVFRQNFRYEDTHSDYSFTSITGIQGLQASRYAALAIDDLKYVAVDNQVEAHFATGPVAHTVLGGIDYLHYDYHRQLGVDFDVPPLDLTGVRNFANFRYRTFIPRPALTSGSFQSQDQLGVYLQEQANWNRFILTLTGRHDTVRQTTQPVSAGMPGILREQNDSAFTGRVGLNYVLAPGLVPYASYATTFTPQVGIDAQGQSFKPATGDQIEAGVKYAIPGTNITGAFAGFDIVQSSLLRQDPSNLANQIATGAVRSKGFEAEMTANFAPGTNVTLSYTHLDFRFLQQTSAVTGAPIDGNTLSGIPGNSFKAFATYQFPSHSPFAGLQIGGGMRYIGSSFADDENTVRNQTVALFDAMIAYDFSAIDPRYRGLRAQINASNIFDRNFVSCQAGFCFRGAPATVLGSLVYRW